MRRSLLLLLVVALSLMLVTPATAKRPLMPNEMGKTAYGYVQALTQQKNPDGSISDIKRVAGSAEESAAALKIKGWLSSAGYKTELQPFTFDAGEAGMLESQNVVATMKARKKPTMKPTPLVIIGAHYDCVPAGAGADDNASGAAVLVEVAQRIAKYKLEYDIVFVAFGAEEAGLCGSYYFVEQMPKADLDRCIAMVNYDSLLVGDRLYAHAGSNEKTWVRDAIMRQARLHKLPLELQPGLNSEYPKGLTPDGFSDYTAFNEAGIPIVAFESTNWSIGDYDGWIQTEKYGSFWHTENDTLAKIEELFPGRPMVRLRAYTMATFEFLKHLNPRQAYPH